MIKRHSSRTACAVLCALVLSACAGASGPTTGTVPQPGGSAIVSGPPGSSSTGPTQEPDQAGGNTFGDIPDNAVFLTYRSVAQRFSIQYVEGWQVTTRPDGVLIRDKDSTEIVQVVPPPSDVPAYVSGTDLPGLRSQAHFRLIRHDTVKVGSHTYEHVSYHLPAPADPVTGKRVPSTIDRYYVPGANGLAVVSLSTPDGIDNVDAFRQMIESYRWR